MTDASIEPFAHAHLDGLIALVAAEGWTEYTEDAERTFRALSAPGVTTLVALADGRVVGAIQVQSDGVIQAHVSMLLIDREWRDAGSAPGSCATASSAPEACARHPHPDRGLLRAPRREPLARFSPHARGPRARGSGERAQRTDDVRAGRPPFLAG